MSKNQPIVEKLVTHYHFKSTVVVNNSFLINFIEPRVPKLQTKMISYNKKRFSKKKLLELYRSLLKPRMIEEKMLVLLRQGRISKWFAGIGQEAIAVGVTAALTTRRICLYNAPKFRRFYD